MGREIHVTVGDSKQYRGDAMISDSATPARLIAMSVTF